MKWTNSYRSFGLKTKRSTGLKTIEHKHTEAERRTRFLMARVIPDKTAERSVGARLAMFAPLPAAARLSVTHDNGTGFARHARLRDEPGMATYFADPYSSWQRGGTRTATA